MTTEQLYELYKQHPSIATDTRKIKAGDIFFALSGPKFIGNHFAAAALSLGAVYAIVDEHVPLNDSRVLQVTNVLQSLQLLAKYHREQFSIPFIAITGSNGKTTTKELVNAVLASRYETYYTQGNLNNHIGVPLTLLQIKSSAQMAVIEMGANHLKEIESYCKIAEPTHGIITNCGKAHLEGFGGEAGVRKGKGELFDYLRQHNGTAFIFADHTYLSEMAAGIQDVVEYGTQRGLVRGKVLPSDYFLKIELTVSDKVYTMQTRLVGDYNLPNVLCAVAVGNFFEVPIETMLSAIENYAPDNSRSQMVEFGSNKVILDAYNANPSSMEVAIENFAKEKAGKKVLLLGAMMELGDESINEHQKVVELVNRHKWNEVVLVGGDFAHVAHQHTYFNTTGEAAEWFKAQRFELATILVKGSRSMNMEKVLQ